jgi:hypothetical protein
MPVIPALPRLRQEDLEAHDLPLSFTISPTMPFYILFPHFIEETEAKRG